MANKVVHMFAGKLGLAGETATTDKASELLRLLEIKSGSSLQHLSDYAKSVLCLDLAANIYGHEFDTSVALKLAGLKKPSYVNSRRILEKLLDISKPIGVTEICVQLGLTEIQEPCITLLQRYAHSSENSLRNIDVKHPQYAAMAVYQVCRQKKIKIPKAKLIGYSHLKPSQWTLLEKAWDTWYRAAGLANGGGDDQQQRRQGNEMEAAAEVEREKKDVGAEETLPAIEEYRVWRERVLTKAYSDLHNLKAAVIVLD